MTNRATRKDVERAFARWAYLVHQVTGEELILDYKYSGQTIRQYAKDLDDRWSGARLGDAYLGSTPTQAYEELIDRRRLVADTCEALGHHITPYEGD